MPVENQSGSCPVALTRAADYSHEAVTQAVQRQFHLLQAERLVRPGMRVTLKPNLLMKRAPESFTTTHPMVVRCVAEALRALEIDDITVADSPGGPYTRAALEGIYQVSGMREAAAQAGFVLNGETAFQAVKSPRGCTVASFNLIQPVAQAELVINLPKVKTHCMTTLSGGVKNLFGCVPGLQKPELHYRFPQEEAFCGMLVDLAATVAPALTIADAVVSMEGDGPSGGSARHTGFLCGSRSPFALDVCLSRLLCLGEVTTVRLSRERGLVPEGEVPTLGDSVEPVADFKRPRSKSLDFLDHVSPALRPLARRLAGAVAQSRPRVRRSRCIGCGKCRESCPADTIQLRAGKAVILPKGCIRCYCCHEMCPVRAIELKRLGLFNL